MNKYRLPTSAQPKAPPAAKEAAEKFMRKGKPQKAAAIKTGIPITSKGPNR